MLPSIVELLSVALESPLGGNGGNRMAQQPPDAIVGTRSLKLSHQTDRAEKLASAMCHVVDVVHL